MKWTWRNFVHHIAVLVASIVLPLAVNAHVPVLSIGRYSNVPSANTVDNLLSASNAVAQNTFAYDVMDRLSLATTVISNAVFTTTYARDLGGLATNVAYAPGKVLTRTYDADGYLTAVSDWLGHTWTFAWDGAGKPTGGTSPGSVSHAFAYDAAGRLSSWNAGDLTGRTITRDAAGLKTREDITAGPLPAPQNVRYAENAFDAADRLVSAQVRYGSHTNAAVAEAYVYDGNGALTNLVSGSNAVFAADYNALGQFASLRLCASALNFSYDALGNRLVSGDRLWIPDHADPLKRPMIEADAATGEPIRYYIWGPGRLLGFIDAADNTLIVAHCDDYGSVVALTDASGNTLHTASYGPNGQDWGTAGENPTPFGWLGGYGVQKITASDHLGPLYLTRYRLYSASLNRFLSADPLGLAGGLNLYAYAEGDPLSYIDPLGLCPEQLPGHDRFNSVIEAYRSPPYQPTAVLYDTTRDPRTRALMHANSLVPEAAIGTAVGDRMAQDMAFDALMAPGSAFIGQGISKAAGRVLGTAKETTTVIGRVKDLQKIGSGEKSLLDRLPNLGNPKANWKQNSGVLRQEMNRGLPIRDASVGDDTGSFLNAERNLLRDREWKLDGNYWNPPN